jgi:hypothetical protein
MLTADETTYHMICSIQSAIANMRGMLRHQVYLESDPAMQEQLRRLSAALLILETTHLQPAFDMADDRLVAQTAPRAHLQ